MTQHQTRHRIGLWAGVVLSLVLAASGCHEIQQEQGIYVGLVHPQNGSLAPYGPGISKAVELAADEINAAGGIQGQPLVIIYKDSGTNPEWARLSTNELIDDGVQAIIGARGSSQSGVMLAITGPLSIPQISYGSSDHSLSTEDYNTFFRTVPTNVEQSQALATLARTEGAREVSILYVDNREGASLASFFEHYYADATHVVTSSLQFAPGNFEYETEVQQALATGADSLLLIAYPGDGATIALDIANSDIRPQRVLVSSGLKHHEFVLASGQSLVDGWVGVAPLLHSEGYARFVSAYKEKYGQTPAAFDDAAAYDAVYLIALAIQRANSLNWSAICDQIRDVSIGPGTMVGPGDWAFALEALSNGEEVNYEGASGNVDMDEVGDVRAPFGKWRISDGQFVEEGEIVF